MNFFNNLKVGKKIIIGYIAILTLMITITAVLLFSLYKLTQEFNFLVYHDQPVLTNAHLLEKLLVDMETGERGFLITGKDEFLEPYYNGDTKFRELLEIEKQLISDNPSQVSVLEEILHLHNKWTKTAAQPEIAKRFEANKATVNANYLQEMLGKEVGKSILDKLRIVLEQLEANLAKKGELESIILTVKIAKDMVDQETGQRGFIITGKDNFLEPYRNGQSQLAINIAALQQRLVEDSENLILLRQIETLANEWIEKAAKPEIDSRHTMNANPITMDDVADLIQVGTGKNILDTIRKQFAYFIKIEKQLNKQRTENVKQNVVIVRNLTIGLALATITIGMLLGVFISHSITRPLVKLTDMAKKMADGDMSQVLTKQNRFYMDQITIRQDEMGDIGKAYDSLANYFGALIADIVQVVQEQANGNLLVTPKVEYKGDFIQIKNSLEISLSNLQRVINDIVQVSQSLAEGGQNAVAKAEYKGDFIQIKTALETAADKLAKATSYNSIQDWIKTGQAQLNEKTSGEQEITKLAKNIISFLTTYVEAQIGLFYQVKQGDKLKIIASYAYTINENTPIEFNFGESLVGQAALKRKVIAITQTSEECPLVIRSVLTGALPRHILLLPFLYEDELKGVIEIGSSEGLTEIHRNFLELIMPNIGIVVNTADSRAKMQDLLKQSQQQAEELQLKQSAIFG
ncbi:CHASE3 domain-containing protein [Thiotrichales bacterium HSG1]|nr:CHASE3 domain-containing protein [Thiotrichales bacterium HSG1]